MTLLMPSGPAPLGSTGRPVQLRAGLFQVAGAGITHPWDASAYLIVGARPLLVDCGGPWSNGDIADRVAAAGVDPRDVAEVWLTHGHVDHAGGAAAWAARGAVVRVGCGDLDVVRSGDGVRSTAASLYGAGMPACAGASPLCDGAVLDTGGVVVRAIATPGHTPGSMSVVVESGGFVVLLAGDTLWGGFDPTGPVDLVAWRASLDLIARLDVDAFSFGHGTSRLVDDHVRERLTEARERFAVYCDPWFCPPRLHRRF